MLRNVISRPFVCRIHRLIIQPPTIPILYYPIVYTRCIQHWLYTQTHSPPPTSILDCTASSHDYPNVSHHLSLINWSIDDIIHQSVVDRYPGGIHRRVGGDCCWRMLQWPMMDTQYLTLADSFQCISVCAYFIQPHSDHCLSPSPTHHRSVVLIETVITANTTPHL